MDDMNLEVNRDESRDAAKKRNRLEPVSPLGRPRERGITGKVGGDEFSRISVQELLTTISTTTDEKELTRLRQEKARRWEVLASQIGEEGLQGIKVGVGILVERAREGKSPKEGEKIPAVVAKIAELKPEIIGLEQQALVGQVIRDEFRIQTLNQGLVPGEIAEETREQEARQRVTDLTGVPVTEYKRGYRPQAGVEIKAPVEEEPKIEEAKESGELKPETVRTISTLVAGGLAVDEVLEELVKLGGVTDGMRGLVDRLVGKREAVEKAAEENTKVAEEKPGPVEKEARPLTWVEIELKLTEYASDQAQGLATAISEDEKTELLKQRRGLVNEEEAKEATRGRKAGVAGLYQKIVDDDQMAGRSGRQRENPLDLFVRGLEDMKRGAGEPEGRLEGVVAAWLDGVERNAEIWAMEAEHKLRAEAGLRPSEELDKRLQALRIEKGLLNWGALKDPTRGRLDALAKAYADWVENVGPEADDYKRAREAAERATRQAEAFQAMAGAGVELVETDKPTKGLFSREFLRRHGLPEKYKVVLTAGKAYEVDVLGALEKMYDLSQIPEWLVTPEFVRACDNPEKARFFVWGIAPLIRLVDREYDGKWSTLSDPEARTGLLSEVGFSMRGVAAAFKDDEQAKRCLGIFLQMDERTYRDGRTRVVDITQQMPRADAQLAGQMAGDFMAAMRADHLTWSQKEAKTWMKERAQEVAAHVGCDRGTAEIMMELASLINGSPIITDQRAFLNKYGSLLMGVDKERAALPLLAKTFIKMQDIRGKKVPRYLVDWLNWKGVDGLFEGMLGMTEVRYFQAVQGMAILKKALDEVDKMLNWEGQAKKMTSKYEVKSKIAELLVDLRTGEVHLIERGTVQVLTDRVGQMAEKVGEVKKDAAASPQQVATEVGWGLANALTFGLAGIFREIGKRGRS